MLTTESRRLRLVLVMFSVQLAASCVWAAEPRIFYSDLDGGPNVGGKNNSGAIVTIYGNHFGRAQAGSFVSIGGAPAAAYLLWEDRKISFQLGRSAVTGDIVVVTANGTSNRMPFIIRPGKIYFVSTAGRDVDNGSFVAPWRTLLKARDALQPGDIVYAMDGVAQETDDGFGWSASMTLHATSGGRLGAPKALVAYPGAKVTIGSATGPSFGLRTTGPASYWTFAGLILRGAMSAVHTDGPSTNWRFIANDMSCPKNTGGSCVSTSKSSYIKFLGNSVHDVGLLNASAMNHGVYFSTDSNHLDIGWNTISNVHGGRGLQVHSTVIETGSGKNQYDIIIHDNIVHDTQCDGVVLATVDPEKGPVEVYNNIIYDAGTGPDNPERTGHWACIMVSGYTNAGTPGRGTVEVYNNTLYNCGSFSKPPYENARAGISNGGHNQNLRIRMLNNIVYQVGAVPYLRIWGPSGVCNDNADCSGIYGSNNVFFGGAPAPSNRNLFRSINSDPMFVNPAQHNFQLRSGSAAHGVGVTTSATTDIEGIRRGGKDGYDAGAIEYVHDDSLARQ